MNLTCTSCGRGRVFFGGKCALCGARNRSNTAALAQLWGKGAGSARGGSAAGGSFFSPGWAIPFKLLWLPVRLVWRLVKIPL